MPDPREHLIRHYAQCVEAVAFAHRVLTDVETLCGSDSIGARAVQLALDNHAARLAAAYDALEESVQPCAVVPAYAFPPALPVRTP